jgi:nitrite reductase/ring-hydroxylating ferredoxin subunit
LFVKVAKEVDLVQEGLMLVNGNGKEAVLGNYEGRFFAVERRCGHMNAPLEMGTLTGYLLTCPMHSTQFNIMTGEVLSGPTPAAPPRIVQDHGTEVIPHYIDMLMSKIRTEDIKTFPVEVVDGWILVDL